MIEIYDNGGETFDRYTIIIDGDVYGMSENPNSPQGFNQYSGKLHELPMARSNGERVTIESVPEEVQKAIEERSKGSEKYSLTLNIVTCGQCGEAFGHKLNVETLTCPYCRFKSDISDFPDMWYENGQDSLFTLER